jgi:hypothetical protein
MVKLFDNIFIFRKQFYFAVSGLNIIGHGNPDNNLESPCVCMYVCMYIYDLKMISAV